MSQKQAEKVKTLQIDRTAYKSVEYSNGEVLGSKDDGQEVVLVSILEEPEYRYFIDNDGDLAREPKGMGWSPPAAKQLSMQALEAYRGDPAIASIRFAKLPFESVTYYESELLEPDQALAAWNAARAHTNQTGLSPVIRTSRIQEGDVVEWQSRLAKVPEDIREADSIDAVTFFETRQAVLEENLAEASLTDDHISADDLAVKKAALDRLSSDELKPGQQGRFHYTIWRQYVVLVLVSCVAWELPVYLGLEGWNDTP